MVDDEDYTGWLEEEWSEVEETPTPLVITPLRGA